ncbi:MAG: RNA pseudouridine synthase [Piscinibacter sp.]|nr:RNA pseudouridine synthase [Piscinibacter sp.]
MPKTHVYRVIRSGEVRLNKGRRRRRHRLQATTCGAAGARGRPIGRASGAGAGVSCRLRGRAPARHRQAGRRGGARRQRGELRRHRADAPGAARGAKFLELVHRLDRETSGPAAARQKRRALVALQDQFRARETGKTYAALVLGAWPDKLQGHRPAAAQVPDRRGRAPRARGVEPATTTASARSRWSGWCSAWRGFTLLDVTIKTGRTHQIRVHLAHHGHPIVGDPKYGDFALNQALARAALAPAAHVPARPAAALSPPGQRRGDRAAIAAALRG